jgi:hypothetical protein
VHEIGAPNEFSTLLATVQQVGESVDKHMELGYQSWSVKLGDSGDLHKDNERKDTVERAVIFTGHFALLRQLRSVNCQLIILMSTLERKRREIVDLVADNKQRARHESVYL